MSGRDRLRNVVLAGAAAVVMAVGGTVAVAGIATGGDGGPAAAVSHAGSDGGSRR